jgi:integrase
VSRKDGAWSFRVDIGRDPATGRRRQVLRQGFRRRRPAEAALHDVLHAAGRGRLPAPSRVSIRGFLEQWLTTQKGRLRPTTHRNYQVAVRRICSQLGAIGLQALTPLQIEKFYADLAAPRGSAHKRLSTKTIGNTHVVLRKALADAERLGQIPGNPAAVAKAPIARRPEHVIWSADDVQHFLAAATDHRLFAAFALSATTGMRRGEVLGLRWRDLNLDGGQLAVVQTLTTARYTPVFSPPKTARSRRTVYLDLQTVGVLRRHPWQQHAERLSASVDWDGTSDLAFADPWGRPLHPDCLTREFDRLLRTADLPRIRLHDLRHRYATLALKTGIRPKVVCQNDLATRPPVSPSTCTRT